MLTHREDLRRFLSALWRVWERQHAALHCGLFDGAHCLREDRYDCARYWMALSRLLCWSQEEMRHDALLAYPPRARDLGLCHHPPVVGRQRGGIL